MELEILMDTLNMESLKEDLLPDSLYWEFQKEGQLLGNQCMGFLKEVHTQLNQCMEIQKEDQLWDRSEDQFTLKVRLQTMMNQPKTVMQEPT